LYLFLLSVFPGEMYLESLFPTEAHLVVSLLQPFPLLPVLDDLLFHPRLDDVPLLETLVPILQQVTLGLDGPQVAGQLVRQLDLQVLESKRKIVPSISNNG